MTSYRGLDSKTGAARQLRQPWREETVLSWSFKAIAKFGSSKYPPRPLGSTTDSSSNSNRRLMATGAGFSSFFRFPFPGVFDTETGAGHLHGRNRLGQILHLSDFNNIRDLNSLLTRGLSNNRKLDTSHIKPSFRSVRRIFPVNHNNIIRPF